MCYFSRKRNKQVFKIQSYRSFFPFLVRNTQAYPINFIYHTSVTTRKYDPSEAARVIYSYDSNNK